MDLARQPNSRRPATLWPMERYLLDSMIFDKIVDTSSALQLAARLTQEGKIDLVATHVQEDEHAEADAQRTAQLAVVPRSVVPTSVFVVGVSRLDGGRLGSEEPFESLRGTKKHTEDGMSESGRQRSFRYLREL